MSTTSNKRPKVRLDYAAATTDLMRQSSEATDERWAKAQLITAAQPSALTPAAHVAPAAFKTVAVQSGLIDVLALQVGQVYDLPISLLDSNPYGARFFYRFENVDKLGASMAEDSQLVPVNGFVKGERIELYDGETRLRSARSTGKTTLQVKLDAPPENALDQHRRSALFNSLRSNHTHLDVAVRLKQFLDEGFYKTQEELGEKYLDDNDRPIGLSRANMYLRIARIPMPFLQLMSEKDHTSTFTVAWAIAGIFTSNGYESSPEKYDLMAREVIKEIQDKELGTEKSKSLITSKLQGPQSRMRADSVPVKYAGIKGTLKVFPERGQLDLSFKGLPEERLTELRDAVEKMLAGQMAL